MNFPGFVVSVQHFITTLLCFRIYSLYLVVLCINTFCYMIEHFVFTKQLHH